MILCIELVPSKHLIKTSSNPSVCQSTYCDMKSSMFVETNLPLRHFNFKLSLLQCFLQGNPTPVVLSHQTPSTYLLFSIANGTWSVHISLLFQMRQPEKAMNWGLFSAGSNVLKLNILIDLFLTNTQLVNYYSSCKLYILILMAPIHCRGSTGKLCNVKFFQISPNEETRHFQHIFFGELFL